MSQFGGGAEGWILRDRGILKVHLLIVFVRFPLASAFSTADEGEVKDVNPGEAAIRTPRVLALASVPTPARVGSCPAKPCASEQVPRRDSARHQLRLS